MTPGPKAGKGRGEEVKTVRDKLTLLTLCYTPLTYFELQNKRADQNEKQAGGQIIVCKMLVYKVGMKEFSIFL